MLRRLLLILQQIGEVKMAENEEKQSHAERMLAAIEATLEGRATDEYKTLKINNREITKHSFDELTRLRNYYRKEVAMQRARKQKVYKNVGYRF